MAIDFSSLAKLLDARLDAGETVPFWLRDDDAVRDTPALQRLSSWAERYDVEILLAIVPAFADETLVDVVAQCPQLIGAVHGWAHKNHALTSEKKMELGSHRALADVLNDVRAGHARMVDMFADKALPVLVPPWNRVDRALVDRLPDIGIYGLSVFSEQFKELASPQFKVMNCNVDLIDWRGTRGGRAPDELVADLVAQIAGRSVVKEPIGILAHHLVHDAAVWHFLDEFAIFVDQHPAANWIGPEQLFK